MFKLSIECTKDIDSINIVFSDGKVASVVGSGPEFGGADDRRGAQVINPTASKPVPQAVIEKPDVPDTNLRRAKVAGNLQNLDI